MQKNLCLILNILNYEKEIVIFYCNFVAGSNKIEAQLVSIDETFGGNGITTIPNGEIDFLTFDTQGNIFALVSTFGGEPAILKTNANGNID